MKKNTNIWLDGIMGVVTGDALGCPVQFESRSIVATHPVTGMRGHGTFNLPAGSWTDDSSLTLALLESIGQTKEINLENIMGNFVEWLYNGAFTPYGTAYDIGFGTMQAITTYNRKHNPRTCGGADESNNGNGSLMRILPACIFSSIKKSEGTFSDTDAIETVHTVGSLTHAHIRANIACGLYFFMAHQVLTGEGALQDRLQAGLTRGFAFYEAFLENTENAEELSFYDRLRDLSAFALTPVEKIRSTGYVVDTLEAAVWSLITTESLEQALLKAANLGDDTDTVAAIAGGLAGLFYGVEAIPEAWLAEIKRREWIEELCNVSL